MSRIDGRELDRERFNTIAHGDCLDLMPQLAAESVDLIVTDPPMAHGTFHATGDASPMTTVLTGSRRRLQRHTACCGRTLAASASMVGTA